MCHLPENKGECWGWGEWEENEWVANRKQFDLLPVNTDNGCKTWFVRNGGGYGGNCDVSWPFDIEDGGEIIDALPLFAIACERQASYNKRLA